MRSNNNNVGCDNDYNDDNDDNDDNITVSHLPGVYAVVCVQVRMAECVLHTRGSLHTHHGGTHARLVYCNIKNGIRNNFF